jgi:hypothetical protein
MELQYEYGTISITEVAWAILTAWGAFRHNRKRRQINARLEIAEALADPPATPAALALYRNDRDTEADWTMFKGILFLAAPLNMIRENPPLSPGSAITVGCLFTAIILVRFRSERRARRRESVGLSPTERREPNEWNGIDRRIHRDQ